MRLSSIKYSIRFFIFLLVLLTLTVNSLSASEFNIKLRKTDISELKQQLMPAFEQNIRFLDQLIVCLEQGKSIDVCIEKYPYSFAESDLENKNRYEQIKQDIKKKITADNISQKHLLTQVKKLLLEIKKIKQCILIGKTANELKDCIVQYKQPPE